MPLRNGNRRLSSRNPSQHGSGAAGGDGLGSIVVVALACHTVQDHAGELAVSGSNSSKPSTTAATLRALFARVDTSTTGRPSSFAISALDPRSVVPLPCRRTAPSCLRPRPRASACRRCGSGQHGPVGLCATASRCPGCARRGRTTRVWWPVSRKSGPPLNGCTTSPRARIAAMMRERDRRLADAAGGTPRPEEAGHRGTVPAGERALQRERQARDHQHHDVGQSRPPAG